MHYISNSTSVGLNIFHVIMLIIGLIVRIFFVACIAKMASEKEQNGLLFGSLALIFPELAFILLYLKGNSAYAYEEENVDCYYF